MSYIGQVISAVFSSSKVPVRKFPQVTSSIMARPFGTSNMKVEHDKKAKRFLIKMGSETAYIDYVDKNGVLDMFETNVPVAQRNRGVGKVLADAAFKYIKKSERKMILSCSYLQKLAKENPGRYSAHLYKMGNKT